MTTSSRWLVAVACALLPFGCSSSEGPVGSGRDAGQTDAGSDGASGSGGASAELKCGGTTCGVPAGGSIERMKACCTDAGGCGLQLPNMTHCLPKDLPGTSNAPDCPSPTFKTPGGDVLGPCCGPNGCGALDAYLGCIPNPEIGAPAHACTYEPGNDCSVVAGIPCDGAEDCPSGQRCCAKRRNNAYVEFGCFDSCAGLADAGAPFLWLELCHANAACENSSYSCLASTVLPAPLSRCEASGGSAADPTANSAAGHVSCGGTVCGTGEKCCIRTPHAPYCAKASEPCHCHPAALGDGGAVDSGAHPVDATTDATTDAAPAPGDARAD